MKRLKKLRVAQGLSQRDVSNKFGYTTPQFVSNWERGVSHPPITALTKLAALYKVERDVLVKMLLPLAVKKLVDKFERGR